LQSLKSMSHKLIITIDGPGGAGKSTVSKILAKKLGYTYLDTGALYRSLAYKAIKENVNTDDISSLAGLCSNTHVILKNVDGHLRVYVDEEEMGNKIRTEKIGLVASKISTFSVVREALLHLQREAGAKGGIVAEGRDMGSVVFPHADFKFFLDASFEERVRRRYIELLAKGGNVEYESIRKDMMIRDKQDKNRKIAPLKEPEDAIRINSDNFSIDQVVEIIITTILDHPLTMSRSSNVLNDT